MHLLFMGGLLSVRGVQHGTVRIEIYSYIILRRPHVALGDFNFCASDALDR